ncbi:MAG: hypothetical protein R3D51_04830 [Hyphomicrobiaceae bacterium]|nr:hypothetical protein [Hyphomicrobiaceae bacterium]
MTHQSLPDHVNPIQWHQALAVSRQTCASVFRDGGTPAEALAAFGLKVDSEEAPNWDKAVDQIASEICAHPMARAA